MTKTGGEETRSRTNLGGCRVPHYFLVMVVETFAWRVDEGDVNGRFNSWMNICIFEVGILYVEYMWNICLGSIRCLYMYLHKGQINLGCIP